MGVLYVKDSKIFCSEYLEIYIPQNYFDTDHQIAINFGTTIELLGVLYCRTFKDGQPGDIKLFDVPTIINLNVYQTHDDEIDVHGKHIPVLALEYLPDSYVLHQTLPKGREVASVFLDSILGGKLPEAIPYKDLINIWWKNLEIAGISYKVPSKIFEMVLAASYRDPRNPKKRYGQYYGSQEVPDEFGYKAQRVRDNVKNLSTFSGMVFEDISSMITNGLNNSADHVEEPISPLEKIIHY